MHPQIHIARLLQGILNHLREQHGILRHPDGLLAAGAGPQGVNLLDLDGRLRGDLRHNALEVQNGDQIIAALGNAGGYALRAAGDGLVRLLDVGPGDQADAHDSVNPEGNEHLVEIGDDEDVLGPFRALYAQILGQIHHCQHGVPGLENPLHCRMGVGHGLNRLGYHDLFDLCHVDAVQVSSDGKLHDLDLVGSGLQQDPVVVHLSHD